MLKQAVIAVVLALPLAAPVWGGTPIDERRALAADGALTVNNLAGLIEIAVWDRDEVHISGELGEDVEELEIDGDAKHLTIHVRYPHKLRGNVEETVLRLQVPRRAALELAGVSADLRVLGTAGDLTASSVSGDIFARAESARLRLNTVSGDIHVQAPAVDAELRTVSGDINAGGLRGSVKGETVSGDLALNGASFASVAVETVSGDLTLGLGLESDGELRAETLSGDIHLRLASTDDASISLKTFSGSLRNALTPASTRDQRSLEYTLGSGNARVQLSTFSGDIHIGR